MLYHVIQVKTGDEGKFIRTALRSLSQEEGRLIWPRRVMMIRKSGVQKETVSSLYPGYLFFQTPSLSDGSILALKRSHGFVRFLRGNDRIVPLDDRDREILLACISGGEIIRKSTVIFEENNRIKVMDGPLKRLEGNIVRVDRRKGRARVALTLYGRTLLADLAFDVIESLPVYQQGGIATSSSISAAAGAS